MQSTLQTTHLKVTGMNCGACVAHVKRALEDLPGAQEVIVDLATCQATVKHSGRMPQQLMKVVTEAGYQAAVINPHE